MTSCQPPSVGAPPAPNSRIWWKTARGSDPANRSQSAPAGLPTSTRMFAPASARSYSANTRAAFARQPRTRTVAGCSPSEAANE